MSKKSPSRAEPRITPQMSMSCDALRRGRITPSLVPRLGTGKYSYTTSGVMKQHKILILKNSGVQIMYRRNHLPEKSRRISIARLGGRVPWQIHQPCVLRFGGYQQNIPFRKHGRLLPAGSPKAINALLAWVFDGRFKSKIVNHEMLLLDAKNLEPLLGFALAEPLTFGRRLSRPSLATELFLDLDPKGVRLDCYRSSRMRCLL